MSLADELDRLAALHERGVLTADEFQQCKAKLIGQWPAPGRDAAMASGSPVNQLRRSHDDRWLGGICGGLARLTDMASWVWRLIFTVLFLFWGSGLLLYILLWVFVPDE
jgi:phage shock protein C